MYFHLGSSENLLSCGLLTSEGRREVGRLKIRYRGPRSPWKPGTSMTNTVLEIKKNQLCIDTIEENVHGMEAVLDRLNMQEYHRLERLELRP